MMEEELQPCVECNMISTEPDKIPEEDPKPGTAPPADGAGDTGILKLKSYCLKIKVLLVRVLPSTTIMTNRDSRYLLNY